MSAVNIGTSIHMNAVGWSNFRNVFFYKGLFWCFYTKDWFLSYQTSSDGVTWSAVTSVFPVVTVVTYVLRLDAGRGYVHYAYCDTDADIMYYCRGKLDAAGTITWDAIQTAVANVAGVELRSYFDICVDSDGYPWIRYSTVAAGNTYPFVTKSSTNDGTWTTQTGFPYQLSTTSAPNGAYLIPLSAGKVYIVYAALTQICGRLWDGATMSAEEVCSARGHAWFGGAIAFNNDDVGLGFIALSAPTKDIIFVKRTYATSTWEADETVLADVGNNFSVVLAKTDDDDVYCFWIGNPVADHIYYTKRTVDGTWDASATDWVTSTEALAFNDLLYGSERADGGIMGLLFETLAVSPYNIWHVYLSVGKPKAHAHSGL